MEKVLGILRKRSCRQREQQYKGSPGRKIPGLIQKEPELVNSVAADDMSDLPETDHAEPGGHGRTLAFNRGKWEQ